MCVITKVDTPHTKRKRPRLMFLVIRIRSSVCAIYFHRGLLEVMNCKRERERDWDSMYHTCAPKESLKDSKVSFYFKGEASFRNCVNFISAKKEIYICQKNLLLIAFGSSKE